MKIVRGSVEWFDYSRREIVEITKAVDCIASSVRYFINLSKYFQFLDEDMRAALFSSAVVSYARPFNQNKAADGRKFILPKKFVSGASAFSDLLHENFLNLRNKIIAHHDTDFVDASILYHYCRIKFENTEIQIVRGGSAITQSLNSPASFEMCIEYLAHTRSALETINSFLAQRLESYLRATNEFRENFVMSRAKHRDDTIKWGERHWPSSSMPVELLPIGSIDVNEWLQKPKLVNHSDGYKYRYLKVTVEINIDATIIAPDGREYRIVTGFRD